MDNIIRIRGARQHNLKNINLDIPKNKLVVFTGLSGSGKSSLAFDTIYAEGQRRYVESLSSYARQFLGIMDKPDVDSIEGLSPAISIDQKSTSHNPRSTVGTVTEIYDYLRLLYARVGHPHCPNCGREIKRQTPDQIALQILELAKATVSEKGNKQFRFLLLSPVVRDRKGEFSGLFTNLRAKGYTQARVDKSIIELNEELFLIKTNKHTVEVVVDKLVLTLEQIKFIRKNQVEEELLLSRLRGAVEQAVALSTGLVVVAQIVDASFTMPEKPKDFVDRIYSEKFACPVCNISLPEIEPRSFSFNSPHGACPTCTGIGSLLRVDPKLVFSEELSISEGGVLPFAKTFMHDSWFSRTFGVVCTENKIDMKVAIKKLSKEQKEILLNGTGEQTYEVAGTNRFGEMTKIWEKYPGISSILKSRLQESSSEYMKGEIQKYMKEEVCPDCGGVRLKKESRQITVAGLPITQVTEYAIDKAWEFGNNLQKNLDNILTPSEQTIAKPILVEICARLRFLLDVGLEYLTLARAASSLSGGEAQRIRLASQIGSGLTGVLYVLDEPSIGLHQRDNQKLIGTLKELRDLGNSVIVVEHDREMMEESDWLVDFGPGAGKDGGQVVASGTAAQIKANKKSLTGEYLTGKRKIIRLPGEVKERITDEAQELTLVGARCHNLKNVTVKFPLGKLICVTGVSGSGKSSLVVETLYRGVATLLNPYFKDKAGAFEKITPEVVVDKVILIDQAPIGRTPRSNPATYTGLFTPIRELFSELPQAKAKGFEPGRFSFNVKGGRCEACEGEGQKRIEMQFLSDVYVTCDVCQGARFNLETLEVVRQGKNIAQVLDLTVSEAMQYFIHQPYIRGKIASLEEVGLGYMHLGQPAPTLSGGEAQRVKLASELSRRSTGKTLYIMDEPTTGLHFADLEKLLTVMHKLTQLGNTVVVIEHNLDIIKNADWIIDMGPEGGDKGGEIIAVGTPKIIANVTRSYTGKYLSELFPKGKFSAGSSSM